MRIFLFDYLYLMMKYWLSTSEKIHSLVFCDGKKIGLSLTPLEQRSMNIDLKICLIHLPTISIVCNGNVTKKLKA